MMAHKRVYPDSNVAVEYRGFEETDWLKLVDATSVTIVITGQFLKELDKLKYEAKRPRAKEKASRFLQWLKDWRSDGRKPIRAGVAMEVSPDAPGAGFDFDAANLDHNDGDDCMIACYLRDRDKHSGVACILVSGDTGLSFKAEHRGLPLVEPNNPLPDEPSEDRKELAALKSQLAKLQAARAMLDLSFPDRQKHHAYVVADIHADTGALRRWLATHVPQSVFGDGLLGRDYAPLKLSRDEYRKKLDAWYSRCLEIARRNSRIIPLQLVLSNEKGSMTATSNAVEISTSNSDYVLSIEGRAEYPKVPTDDRLAMASVSVHSTRRAGVEDHFTSIAPDHARLENLPPVNHRSYSQLPTFFVHLPTGAVESFNLSCVIHSANQAEPVPVTLHFILSLAATPTYFGPPAT